MNMKAMKKATKVRDITSMKGVAHLYKLNPPHEGHEYVVVSAVYAMFTGPETFIFPSDEHGEITSFLELEGSLRGTLEPADALREAGYEIE